MKIFDNLCRSCNINKEKLLNIHDTHESTKLVRLMLEYCLQTTIANEPKYPEYICYECLHQLEISYRFIKRFNLSQSEFEESYLRLQDISSTEDGSLNENSVGRCYYDELNSKSSNIKRLENVTKLSLDTHMPVKCENILTDPNAPNRLSDLNVPLEPETSATSCSLCNKAFLTKKALNLHQKLSHKQKALNF